MNRRSSLDSINSKLPTISTLFAFSLPAFPKPIVAQAIWLRWPCLFFSDEGVDKRRSDESLRSSTFGMKGVQGSLGSCDEVGESRPWRKPVKEIGDGMVRAKNVGVDAVVVKRTVAVKPKPLGDRKIESFAIEKGKQGIVATSEHVEVQADESSLDITMAMAGESEISHGAEISLPSEERVKREALGVASEIGKVTAEETSPDTKDLELFKKSCNISKGQPSLLRLPSIISSGLSVGRAIEGQKSVEGSKSLDGKKDLRGSKSFDGRKVVQGSKNFDGQGRKSLDARKRTDESKIVDPEITQKDDGKASNVENRSEVNKSANEMKSIESKRSPAKTRLEKSKSLNLETNIGDGVLLNGKNKGKSETTKNLVAVPKSKILSLMPSCSLNTSDVKPLSLLNPSTGSHSKTSDEDRVGKKISTSKIDAKKIKRPSTLTPSVNVEDSTDTKRVRVVRVLPSARTKVTKVVAKDLNDQGVKEYAVDQVPAKKSLASTKIKITSRNSLLSSAPSVTKSTVRSRTSYQPSRVKKSLEESEQKLAAKDDSMSGLQKSKVDLESKKPRPSKLRVSTTIVPETTHRRSYLKKDGPAGNIHKNISDKFLPGRRKKTIQVLSNKVIEDTANRLIRTKKSKVLALIGAFETVISIQKKSSARATSKTKKRISASKISR